jgi:hypothetical protein
VFRINEYSQGTTNVTYVPAVSCAPNSMYPNALCPQQHYVELQGSAESYFLNQTMRNRQFMVYSCTAMNLLRQQWNQSQVACVPQAELDSVASQIGVFVNYEFAFFDAIYFH